jgi:hypothetical protein
MRRILVAAVVAASAGSFAAAPPASAICRQLVGPVCLPACPLPDPDDPLPYACPL